MDALSAAFVPLLYGGLGNLAAYLAAHVLLCLLPAFFIAGAMAALIPKETITRFLGRNSSKAVSYPAAAAAGSLLAVCSCTIVPLFAGIYRKGAGLGPAITFLFFAPAANILALVYTGGIIGPDLAAARFILSLTFGIGIGLIMALVFRADDAAHDKATDTLFSAQRAAGMQRAALLFLLVWIALLLAGTLKLSVLTGTAVSFDLPATNAAGWQAALDRLVPYDAARGEEGVSVQGVVLIALLAAIGFAAWRGFENIQDGITAWTRTSLALIGVTLLFAALSLQATPEGLRIGLTGKFFGVAAALAVLYHLGSRRLAAENIQDWLWESWRFVKQIFPLLVIGVFLVGVIRVLIRPEWIEAIAGSNSLSGNLAGVAFGVFMYFPTLVEVPIAKMFLDLGMHRGPLLAYLMSDPELSLQSILIISAILGRKKTAVYVGLVALFSAAAGLTYGAWIDGMPLLIITLWLAAFIGLLVTSVNFMSRNTKAKALGGV
ncbi:permease [Aromatoleum anaerobium]|uniref:Permease n=1 Tax=Aromatoleum anaerobium TaxID=182180 RepID=A0ABX1PQV1_9RHOO|nr:permease [Aromatoleum anaerobium]MCK0506239.1 permease [Aromatoleum anaerobium]